MPSDAQVFRHVGRLPDFTTLDSWTDNADLTLEQLSWKLVMLLCLVS